MSDRITSYAAAIVQIAEAEGQLENVTDEMRTIASAVDASSDLRNALTDPSAPVGQRLALLETQEIATAVARLVASANDRELAEVTVAAPLDDQRRESLRLALEAATGKQLELQVVVDASVVGGVRAIVGDTVLDGSLARRLDDIRTRVGA
jgi:F-type H+-transporting ATPase subunit delta